MSYKSRLKKALDPRNEDRTPVHEFVPHPLEGTVHTGPNRAALRARGVRSKDRPDPISVPAHWVRARQQALAEQAAEKAAENPPAKKSTPAPKDAEWRFQQYGMKPTYAQLRRLTKKFRQATRKAFNKE